MTRNLLLLWLVGSLPACSDPRPAPTADHLRRAHEILATTPIVDTHIDFPWHLVERKKAFTPGYTALALQNPDGSPMEKIADVAYFHQRGIRYVTLTHSLDNLISDSSYDTLRANGGLSAYGREVVREMNRVGIMVDVSHLSDDAIWDVLEVAQKPLIATHSACRHFTPGFERNLPDTLIRAIARTQGVVQVPFSQLFLGEKMRNAWRAAGKEREEKKIPDSGPEADSKNLLRKRSACVAGERAMMFAAVSRRPLKPARSQSPSRRRRRCRWRPGRARRFFVATRCSTW